MSNENNRRYIGEVFIDGKSDKLLQEFLTNLFNSYNGPGKGFNADMVDDWHLQDIVDYVDDQVATKLDSIQIGQTVFTIYDNSKFLQLTDIIYSNIEDMPWADLMKKNPSQWDNRIDSTLFDDDEYYLASDIIIDLYYFLDKNKVSQEDFNELVDDFNEVKTDYYATKEDYKDFKKAFDGILRDVEIIDEDGEKKIIKFLDAQMVNGFRIIPITQVNYDRLPEEARTYWRNIYIIMDNVPNDYIDPISYKLFQEVKIVYNRETGYLEYYDGISVAPKQLMSLKDLLDGADFSTIINNHLEETTNITYNPVSLKESLKELVINNADLPDLPFITKTEGAILASNITTSQGTITSQKNDKNFTTFDISKAFDTKFNEVNNNMTTLRNLIDSKDTDLRSYVSSNFATKNSLSGATDSLTSQLTTINNRLTTRLNTLEEKFYKSSLRILIGRYSDKGGEFGTRLQLPYAGDGLYAHIISDDPKFDYTKLNAYIYFNDVQYHFNYANTEENRKITLLEDGSAITGRLGVNQNASMANKNLVIFAIARYGNDMYPATAQKVIELQNYRR